MKLLELYCSKSVVEKDAKDKGIFVMSIDLSENYEYKIFPTGYFHISYASPKTKELFVKTVGVIDKIKPKHWFIDFINKNVIEKLSLENAMNYEFKMAGRKKMLIWSNLKNWKRVGDCKFYVEDLLDAVNVVYFSNNPPRRMLKSPLQDAKILPTGC